jgi:hypothetical protein
MLQTSVSACSEAPHEKTAMSCGHMAEIQLVLPSAFEDMVTAMLRASEQ